MAQQPNYTPSEGRRPVRESPPGHDDRSIGDLLRELAGETRTLVRQEIQLAKTEVREKASEAGKDVGLLAAGGFVAYAGLLALVMALALLLGTFMPDWLGFLIVGAVVIIVGYVLVQQGRRGLKQTNFALERTTDTLKEGKQWISEEVREVKEDPAHLGTRRHNETPR